MTAPLPVGERIEFLSARHREMQRDLVVHWGRLVVVGLLCAGWAQAVLSVHTAEGGKYWQKLSFPAYKKWDFKDESLSGHPRLAVRVSAGELLFAEEDSSSADEDQVKQTSLTQYVLSLETRKLREARGAEWASASQIGVHVDSPFRPKLKDVRYEVQVPYAGRRFVPHSDERAVKVALSPDGMWLAMMSDAGSFPEGFDIFSPTYGRLRVDIFNVGSGKAVAGLSGWFLGDDPEEGFDSSAWVSDRQFLLPGKSSAEAWLCDLTTAEPSGDPVFDVAPAHSEIVGFWQQPERFGSTVHLVIRVPDNDFYDLKADVNGCSLDRNYVKRGQGPGFEKIDYGCDRQNGTEVLDFEDIRLIRKRPTGDEVAARKERLREPLLRTEAQNEYLVPIAVTPYLVTRNAGSGTKATFTFVLSDRHGAANLKDARIAIRSQGWHTEACSVLFSFGSQGVALLDESGNVDQSGTIDSGARLQNSYCTILDRAVKAAAQDTVQVRVSIQLSAKFSGRYNVYAKITDREGGSSTEQWLGSWDVPEP